MTPLKNMGWQSQYSSDDMFLEAFLEFKSEKISHLTIQSLHRKKLSGQILNLLKKVS
jgi:hypothetical protein